MSESGTISMARREVPPVEEGAATPRDGASGLRWPLFVLSIVWTVLLYWSTVTPVVQRWYQDPTYSHGFLVAALSAWLAWRAWRRGDLEDTTPSAVALLPLAVVGLVWLLAQAAGIRAVEQLILPAMWLCCAWVLFGRRGAVALLLPIGIIYTVLPVWDYLRPALQGLTVAAVGEMLFWLDIPAFIRGYRVDLPGGSFEIVSGCSGLHFFMAATALAAIHGYLFLGRAWAQSLLLAVALAVAIVANWIRVIVVIVVGHHTEMEHFLIADHYYFGWVVFAVMMVPVLLLGRRLELVVPPREPAGDSPRLSLAPHRGMRTLPLVGVLAVVAPGLAWPAIAARAAAAAGSPVLPVVVGHWQAVGDASPDWQPHQVGAAVEQGLRYTGPLADIDAWLFYYPRQTMERKLGAYGSSMARPEDGLLVDEGRGELRLVSRDTGQGRLIRYRYVVAGHVTRSSAGARYYQLVGNLRAQPEAVALVVSARCAEQDCREARLALEDFESALPRRLPWRDQ